MTELQAFSVMYYLLNRYFNVYKYDRQPGSGFNLAVLLSCMALIEEDGIRPFDIIYWDNWIDLLRQLHISGDMDKEDILVAVRAFTKYYENEYGFALGDTVSRLHAIDGSDPDLEEAMLKAQALLRNWDIWPMELREGLNDIKQAGIAITWKLIDIGFRGNSRFSCYLSAEEVIKYAKDQLDGTDNEQVRRLATKSKDEVAEINTCVFVLAQDEGTSYGFEFRKWRALHIKDNLPDTDIDFIVGLTILEGLWALFDFPEDTPYVIRGKGNTIAPRDYYTEENYRESLQRNLDWVTSEFKEIKRLQ